MSAAFERALARTRGFEGELADDPRDRGGRTNHGITQTTYDIWRASKQLPRQSVDLITDAEVSTIYFSDYWTPCRCEEMPESLAAVVFDMAVHSGVWNAKITLQAALRLRQDGVIGPITLKAALAPEAPLLFLKRRGAFIQDVIRERPMNVEFLEGWINRLLDLSWKGGSA